MKGDNAKQYPRWPLFLIAAPAAVAVFSGWVSLGALCGFGLVQPLPGIVGWHLDTAITLPVGVEAYGAYALGAWLTPGTPELARTFARRSAIGALVLGMLGQVVYHLLAAAHATRAPWPVVVLVSCLPVITLGFGAALTHLLRGSVADAVAVETAPQDPDAAFREMVGLTEELGLYDDARRRDGNAEDAGESADAPEVPRDAEHAALLALRGTMAAGNPLSLNQLATKFGLTRAQAKRVKSLALADDGDRHEETAALALLGLPDAPTPRLRRIGEPLPDTAPGTLDAYWQAVSDPSEN